jgi:hypothetical protein
MVLRGDTEGETPLCAAEKGTFLKLFLQIKTKQNQQNKPRREKKKRIPNKCISKRRITTNTICEILSPSSDELLLPSEHAGSNRMKQCGSGPSC